MDVVGNWFYGSIEHVGSTSVPGLIAKQVIDIMFGVTSLEESESAIDVLERNGYTYFHTKKMPCTGSASRPMRFAHIISI